MIIEVKGLDSYNWKDFAQHYYNIEWKLKEYGTYVDGIRKRILAGTTRVYQVSAPWNH